MANSNNKQSSRLISNVFGVAKKLSHTGLSVLNHVTPSSVNRLSPGFTDNQVIQGTAREKGAFEKKTYANPQQMMREHLPQMSSQLLGRHYKKINHIASFISPNLNDKLADYFFEKLNDFVSELSSVDAILKEVGAKSLEELAKDPERAQRISMALANQNKIIASIQGVLTGGTGVIGAAIDVPTSLALALRSVYQTGHAYGFELKTEDHAVVEYIFKQIDMGSVAEKQALLVAVRTFSNVLQSHDVNQLQNLLGSANDAELLKKWITQEDGSFKWAWLNHLPQLHIFSKLSPLAGMGISALYSWKLVDDATDKAQLVFSQARQFLIQHPNQNIDTLSAYEKAEQMLVQISPVSHQNIAAVEPEIKLANPVENVAIVDIKIGKKPTIENTIDNVEQQVHDDLQRLAVASVSDAKNQIKVENASDLEQEKMVKDTSLQTLDNSVITTSVVKKKRAPRKSTDKTKAAASSVESENSKS
ncbi:EcsC family protein [Acinetobacter sp. ANC 4648]|uniref:EcsC family protein n=1 Tax=Acinetobacter sp. ANC 4648 TaxID=1977875 RepID=UPI000A349ADC|nr:EcsC family protein [Acinetobacter sp. ANC 4648]OTG79793.1 EcsC family protein [Acinetobacter sp. ANC 4648]